MSFSSVNIDKYLFYRILVHLWKEYAFYSTLEYYLGAVGILADEDLELANHIDAAPQGGANPIGRSGS